MEDGPAPVGRQPPRSAGGRPPFADGGGWRPEGPARVLVPGRTGVRPPPAPNGWRLPAGAPTAPWLPRSPAPPFHSQVSGTAAAVSAAMAGLSRAARTGDKEPLAPRGPGRHPAQQRPQRPTLAWAQPEPRFVAPPSRPQAQPDASTGPPVRPFFKPVAGGTARASSGPARGRSRSPRQSDAHGAGPTPPETSAVVGTGNKELDELMQLSWEELATRIQSVCGGRGWIKFSAKAETRPDMLKNFPCVYFAGFLAGEEEPPVPLLLHNLDASDKQELVRRAKMAVKAGAEALKGKGGRDPERYSEQELRGYLRETLSLIVPQAQAARQAQAQAPGVNDVFESWTGEKRPRVVEIGNIGGPKAKRARGEEDIVDFTQLGPGATLRLLNKKAKDSKEAEAAREEEEPVAEEAPEAGVEEIWDEKEAEEVVEEVVEEVEEVDEGADVGAEEEQQDDPAIDDSTELDRLMAP